IARHEAGHALVAAALGAGRVERVTIEPRGQALGVTFVARHTEEPLYREQELHARLAMLLAGRQAELDHYGDTSSGAADDLKRATELAVSMAGSMGLGKTFGLLSLTAVPREFISPQIQEKLLDEAQAMLEDARARCEQVLAMHGETLDALAGALIRDETVSGPRLAALLDPLAEASAPAASVRRVA
ncbi:MAG: cell division protein, partial [Burkholderiaceae bacterium]